MKTHVPNSFFFSFIQTYFRKLFTSFFCFFVVVVVVVIVLSRSFSCSCFFWFCFLFILSCSGFLLLFLLLLLLLVFFFSFFFFVIVVCCRCCCCCFPVLFFRFILYLFPLFTLPSLSRLPLLLSSSQITFLSLQIDERRRDGVSMDDEIDGAIVVFNVAIVHFNVSV